MRLVRFLAFDLAVEDLRPSRQGIAAGLALLSVLLGVWLLLSVAS